MHTQPGRKPGWGGDSSYQGQTKVNQQHAPKATDFTNRRDRAKHWVDEVQRARNKTKSRVRARVEHPILVIREIFPSLTVRFAAYYSHHAMLAGKRVAAMLCQARRTHAVTDVPSFAQLPTRLPAVGPRHQAEEKAK